MRITMIRLSVNLLNTTLEFLKTIDIFDSCNVKQLPLITHFYQIPYENLYDISSKCKWIHKKDKKICISESGKEILNNQTDQQATFRKMIFDYTCCYKPIWGYRIPFGRKEASLMMSKDDISCFYEAGLLTSVPDRNIISWWDKLAAKFRMHSEEYRNDIGRTGEFLTIQYEENRTNAKPKWISLETNLAGYDIISQISNNNDTSLLIETKSSSQNINNAYFYISSREWDTATISKNYSFYLWLIGTQNKLAIISPKMVGQYIPINKGVGEWTSAKIPFNVFEREFKSINEDKK